MANKPTSEQARETAELERLMRERTAAAPTDEQHAAADARVDALEASEAEAGRELDALHGQVHQYTSAAEASAPYVDVQYCTEPRPVSFQAKNAVVGLAVARLNEEETVVRVPGEEEADVAQALEDFYYEQRKQAAQRLVELGHKMEEADSAVGAARSLQEAREVLEQLSQACAREDFHRRVAMGAVRYEAPDA